MSRPDSIDWERVKEDPDPVRDLGYEGESWDVIAVEEGGTAHRLFLPPDDDNVWREEFVIAEADLVCDLVEER